MDQVTDCAFREMVARLSGQNPRTKTQKSSGNNFAMFTEFVSVDGLLHPDGKKRLLRDLKFTNKQRPIVAQIWGNDPDKFLKAAKIIKKLKFDGIDINMGCPQSKEIGMGACSALIKNPKLAQKIIKATKKGAGGLPVSVKTRIGYEKNIVKDWIKVLLKAQPAAIIVHGRTKKEMSKVPAHWDAIADAVATRNKLKSKTLIIGNGDVISFQDGLVKAQQTGVDGIMIGRASIGNPWVFNANSKSPSVKEKLLAAVRHAKLFEKWYKNKRSFATIRKHLKNYVSGFEGAKELRARLMQTKNAAETARAINNYLKPV